MEGRGRDLEENADEHKRQRGEDEGLVLREGREMGDLVDLRGSSGAEDERDAVEQKRGGEGAEEEVLDGGFRTAAGLLAVAGEDVGGDGGDFEGDEDEEQLNRAGKQAHADGAEDDERVELALVMARLGQSVEREQEGYEDDATDEDVEEDGEGAGFDGGEEAGSLRQGELPEAGPEGERGSDGGDPAERTARPRGRERGVEQHDGDAGEGEDDLGKDAVDVGSGDSLLASGVDDYQLADLRHRAEACASQARCDGGWTPVWMVVEPERWRETHDEHEDNEGREDGEFSETEIGGGFGGGQRALRAVEEALDKPEHVSGAENDAERGDDGPTAADLGKGAGKDDEFSNEAAQHGQADHGEGGDDEIRGCAGKFGSETAVGGDDAGGVTELECAEEQEQCAVDYAVGKDLVDGAGPAGEGEAVDGKHDEAEMAERGEGHQDARSRAGREQGMRRRECR